MCEEIKIGHECGVVKNANASVVNKCILNKIQHIHRQACPVLHRQPCLVHHLLPLDFPNYFIS